MTKGYILHMYDPTTCGGRVLEGAPNRSTNGIPVARMGDTVTCGKDGNSYRIVGGLSWITVDGRYVAGSLDSFSGCPCQARIIPQITVQTYETVATAATALVSTASALPKPVPVFAKSRERGAGNTDAGTEQEPHTNFASMGIFQAAVAAATSATRAQTVTAGVNVLEQVFGRSAAYGTWAITGAEVAAGGIGISVAGFLVGMMPGKLNEDEQDFIDRMRLAQMREAPTRVRYSWENDTNGNPVPRGYHTPPGKDMVRVRKMEWDRRYEAYTFTTEEESPVTIIWTPDSSGVNTPSNTGNQTPPRLPGTILVDPLPDDTRITSTTAPTPDEKSFADYILILPVSDIPPIYIYLSKARGGLPKKDHSYHPAPKTEEIVGISGIQKAKKKTPKQDGGGLRERWVDAKGKRVYEWDSQHGELEEYRASDGEHLGSVDYKTGNQLKPVVKGRSIKRYL